MTTSAVPTSARPKLFVSYAREDRPWVEEFKPYLTPAVTTGALEVWDDGGIPAGADWAPAIDSGLASATAALVLVSVNLLKSQYILERELPAIHARRQAGSLQLYWIPVGSVGSANLEHLGLDTIQVPAPANPERPLDAIVDERERKQAVAAICNRILLDLKIGRTARLSREKRTDAVNTALERLCRKLDLTPGERIGYGDFTIVWSGRMQGRGVAIKVLAESPFRERSPAFEDRVRRVRGLEDPCFLKLRHSDLDEEPHALVMDHTEAPTLAQHLQSKGKFHPGLMARLIQRLVVALEEYHRCGLRYGALSPENVFYDEAASPHPMLRLSAVGVSSHLSQFHETAGDGWFPRDGGEATYLVPEQYEGQPYTDKSDQYGVGLLAFEMLEGRPPVTVSRLADLEKKRQFFDDPARFAGEWPRVYSHLRDVVFRMLRRDPAERFPGLGDVHRALAHLEPADVALAKKSYSRVCAARPEFYAEFYRRFFTRCPEARAFFGNLEAQYVKLDSALHYLLNFADQDMTEPTALTTVARSHERLRVTEAQFDHFGEALLETLRGLGEGEAALEAWQKTIRPGFRYMKLRSAGTRRGPPP